METLSLILFGIWAIGALIIGRKHSRETLSSLFGFKPAETTFKGWIYLILWGVVMFFIIGLAAMAGGY
jgi:hypothetical protein